ncbi:MAG: hypothetical protein L6R19_01265 [Alphaproteobacteria bacterium]|nr:hypothetical protein [Alphaproteobacteria bacterium]
MRQKTAMLLALAALIGPGAAGARAQTPPTAPVGGPRAEYTAEFKLQGYGGPKVRGRVYAAPGKERREIADIWGGTTLILRYDLGLAWTLVAGRPFYSEFPLSRTEPAPAPGAVPPGLVFRERDDINDVPASRYDFPAAAGGTGGEIWLTEDGIALRIDGGAAPGAPEIRFELDNLVRGPQDPARFEVPQGYRKLGAPPPPPLAQPAPPAPPAQ